MIFRSLALSQRTLLLGLQSTFFALAGLRGAHWPEEFVNSGDYSSDIVGRGLSSIEPLHVTAMAEQVPVQREAAAAFLITQLHPAILRNKNIKFTSAQAHQRSWESALLNMRLLTTGRKGLEGMDSQKRNLRKYLSWTPGVAATAEIMRGSHFQWISEGLLVLGILTPGSQIQK